jgi:hypothetical protein
MPVAALGALAYSIKDQPATVHDLLIQKSTGAFDLVVWDENVRGSDEVLVNFGRPLNLVNIYDVTAGVSPIQVLKNTGSVPLKLSDHAVIIELPH